MNAIPLLGVIQVSIDGPRWINCITSLNVAVRLCAICYQCYQHCRVLIHDMRSPSPLVMSLKGHDSVITDVQMDSWKVASGR